MRSTVAKHALSSMAKKKKSEVTSAVKGRKSGGDASNTSRGTTRPSRQARPAARPPPPSSTDAPMSRSEQRRKERAERRVQIREEARRHADLGCCHFCQRGVVKCIHVIDVLAGLALMAYGFAVSAQPNPPAGTVSSLILYGTFLVTTAIFGILGFLTGWCRRCGLVISAYVGPSIAFLEFFFGLYVLVAKAEFVQFLKDNKRALLINDQIAENLGKSVAAIFVLALICAVAEIMRYLMLLRLRENLLRYDAARRRAIASRRRQRRTPLQIDTGDDENDISEPFLPASRGDDRKKPPPAAESGRKGVAAAPSRMPRIDDENDGNNDQIESSVSWADDHVVGRPDESRTRQSHAKSSVNVSSDTKSKDKRSWFTRRFGKDTKKNNDNIVEESSTDEFAPVDETLHTDDLWWSQAERSEDVDLSWVNDDPTTQADDRKRPPRGL